MTTLPWRRGVQIQHTLDKITHNFLSNSTRGKQPRQDTQTRKAYIYNEADLLKMILMHRKNIFLLLDLDQVPPFDGDGTSAVPCSRVSYHYI